MKLRKSYDGGGVQKQTGGGGGQDTKYTHMKFSRIKDNFWKLKSFLSKPEF